MVQRTIAAYAWIIPTVVELAMVIAMLIRGLHRKLPFFWVYLIYDALDTVMLLPLKKYGAVYIYGYWYSELVGWTLALAVIYEIYSCLLKEYAALQKFGSFIFWAIGIICVLIAVWIGISSPGKPEVRFIQDMITLERSIRVVQGGLLVALFVFASFFGLSWKNYLFGIALGLATYACVELVIVAIRAYLGPGEHMLFRWLKPVAYNVTVLVWGVYLLRPARESYLKTLPRTELAAWNETLQDLLHR